MLGIAGKQKLFTAVAVFAYTAIQWGGHDFTRLSASAEKARVDIIAIHEKLARLSRDVERYWDDPRTCAEREASDRLSTMMHLSFKLRLMIPRAGLNEKYADLLLAELTDYQRELASLALMGKNFFDLRFVPGCLQAA